MYIQLFCFHFVSFLIRFYTCFVLSFLTCYCVSRFCFVWCVNNSLLAITLEWRVHCMFILFIFYFGMFNLPLTSKHIPYAVYVVTLVKRSQVCALLVILCGVGRLSLCLRGLTRFSDFVLQSVNMTVGWIGNTKMALKVTASANRCLFACAPLGNKLVTFPGCHPSIANPVQQLPMEDILL